MRKNVTNKIFGRLTAISPTNKRTHGGSVMWLCQCQCGIKKLVNVSSLINGSTASCGCLIKEFNGRPNKYVPTSAYWLKALMCRYGLSPKEWTFLVLRSNGHCELCGSRFKNASRDCCVDHDHKTNKVRGLLCASCNTSIAILENDTLLALAQKYLIETPQIGDVKSWVVRMQRYKKEIKC